MKKNNKCYNCDHCACGCENENEEGARFWCEIGVLPESGINLTGAYNCDCEHWIEITSPDMDDHPARFMTKLRERLSDAREQYDDLLITYEEKREQIKQAFLIYNTAKESLK